jgi:hypothetical protein
MMSIPNVPERGADDPFTRQAAIEAIVERMLALVDELRAAGATDEELDEVRQRIRAVLD